MIPALVLACALHAHECRTGEAALIFRNIDASTDSDELRAQMVVWTYEESGWRVTPRPQSWDSKAGLAVGAFQLWTGGNRTLLEQARTWIALVQHGGLANACGYGAAAKRMAWRRASVAARLMAEASALPE